MLVLKLEFCYYVVMKSKNEELPKKIEERIKMREKKHKPKMRVSGKSVFQLKKILKRDTNY